jgi:hypothetical protein
MTRENLCAITVAQDLTVLVCWTEGSLFKWRFCRCKDEARVRYYLELQQAVMRTQGFSTTYQPPRPVVQQLAAPKRKEKKPIPDRGPLRRRVVL